MRREGMPSGRGDLWVGAALALTACGVTFALGAILWNLLADGSRGLSLDLFLDPPRDAGRAGGILPVLVSTAGVLGICMAVTLPLSLATAVFLSEWSRKSGRPAMLVRRSLDVLAGVPSIVFGLFGNAFFCVALGLGYSILSGGLTLACMTLPLVIRTAEAGLSAVPTDQRLAAAALGFSRSRTLFSVLLPAAAPALAVGFVLGVGRALAETAAVLFTSGYGLRMPGSLLDSGRTLSVHIYDLATNVPGGETRAWTSALVLVVALLLINMAAAAGSRAVGSGQGGTK